MSREPNGYMERRTGRLASDGVRLLQRDSAAREWQYVPLFRLNPGDAVPTYRVANKSAVRRRGNFRMTKSTRRWRLPALLAITALGAGVLALGASPRPGHRGLTITRIAGRTGPKPPLPSPPTRSRPARPPHSSSAGTTSPTRWPATTPPGSSTHPILLSGTTRVPPFTLTALNTLNDDQRPAPRRHQRPQPERRQPAARHRPHGQPHRGRRPLRHRRRIALGPRRRRRRRQRGRRARPPSCRRASTSPTRWPLARSSSTRTSRSCSPGWRAADGHQSTLTTLGIEHVIITGGPVAIPASMEAELDGMGIPSSASRAPPGSTPPSPWPSRPAPTSASRTSTSTSRLLATSPTRWPVARTAARRPPPRSWCRPRHERYDFDAVCDALKAIAPNVATAHAFGGPLAISDAVLAAMDTCATPDRPRPGHRPDRASRAPATSTRSSRPPTTPSSPSPTTPTTPSGSTAWPSTQAAFEAALTAGDDITYTNDTTPADVDVHDLTNRTVTSRHGRRGRHPGAEQLRHHQPGHRRPRAAGRSPTTRAPTSSPARQHRALFEQNVSEGDTITVTEAAGVKTYHADQRHDDRRRHPHGQLAGRHHRLPGRSVRRPVRGSSSAATSPSRRLAANAAPRTTPSAASPPTGPALRRRFGRRHPRLLAGRWHRALRLTNAAPPVQTGQAIDDLEHRRPRHVHVREADGDRRSGRLHGHSRSR